MPKKSGKKKKTEGRRGDGSPPPTQRQKKKCSVALQGDVLKLQELLGDDTQPLDVDKTPLEKLFAIRQPQELALRLAQSLIALRARLVEMENERLKHEVGMPGRSSAMARRAREKVEKLELEIHKTERISHRLMVMSKVVGRIVNMRERVITETYNSMKNEVQELEKQIERNEELIRQRYVDRVNMLHRYWLWRTLQELGDLSVGQTFGEELSRGPRYRSVGLQNNILSDTIEQQLSWLLRFAEKEKIFREHVRRLETLVEELTDVMDALEEALTCRVCNLLFEDPVIFWPCGHTFCLVCFDSLSIAPSLFRCPTCGSIGTEGYVHNLLIGESVAKWMFKDSGYGDIHGSLSLIRLHLSKFRKEVISSRITYLRECLADVRYNESKPEDLSQMDIIYRAF